MRGVRCEKYADGHQSRELFSFHSEAALLFFRQSMF
jgi:hypothetical protein